MMNIFILTTLLFMTTHFSHAIKYYVNVTGDITLGALFPIHKKGINGTNCGKIQVDDGIQPLEAMLYTVRQINQDSSILPGIRLGVLAFDTCDNPNYALEQALNFVKGFIAHVNEHHEQEFHCSDGSVPKFLGGGFDKVVAVLAAQSSSVTLQVASMLRLFNVPQISYMATSPILSNKERYPHFFRTVPSDFNQANAMLEILKMFEWTYVSVVYSDTEYGNHGYETLVSLANNYSICFSAPQRIDKEHFVSEDYDNVIRTIANKTEVRVVVLFAEKTTTLKVLEAARRLGLGTRFVWIGSDSWSNSNHREFLNPHNNQSKDIEMTLEGALAVQPLSSHLSGFDDYFTNLSLKHQKINPWFYEFWQEYHKCDKNKYNLYCDDLSAKLNFRNGYKQQKFLHFVRDAVYAVAYALHNIQMELCGKNFIGMCGKMKHIDGEVLSKYLNTVTFNDESGNPFRFINNVDGPPRYSILNYQKDSNDLYHWHIVGNYTQSNNGKPILYLNSELLKYRKSSDKLKYKNFPDSNCARPCKINQIKVREKPDTCCWGCRNCGLYQYKVNDNRCEDCNIGTKPTNDKKYCIPIDEEFIDYSSVWAIGTIAVSTIGILITIIVLLIFWIYSNTPIIKAFGRELSSVILLGILLSFLMTFPIVAKPTDQTCAITRCGIGVCYTISYAALVTKTNRIHRIFNIKSNNFNKPKYTSPMSQLIITFILILIELLINAIWLLELPPSISHLYPSRDLRLRICTGMDNKSYMISLIYPFILIVVCTFYAIKTRKCPEGFNESQHIAFTNYTTLILWLAFVPLYLISTNNSIRIVTLALSLSINSFVQLVCLFLPKIYIVLMKPEKNTKELVMAPHKSPSYFHTPSAAAPIIVFNGNAIINNTLENNSLEKPVKTDSTDSTTTFSR